MNNSPEALEVAAFVNLGGSGQYKVAVGAQKDLTSADLKVNFNGRDVVSAELKGKHDTVEKSLNYELKYSAIGIGEGNLRLELKGGDEKYLYIVITRGGEIMLEYWEDFIGVITKDSHELTFDSKLDVSTNSMLYPLFCKG